MCQNLPKDANYVNGLQIMNSIMVEQLMIT